MICACDDGPVKCSHRNCNNWADICQGMTECWDHYENNEKETN